jgi:hypothetical protein
MFSSVRAVVSEAEVDRMCPSRWISYVFRATNPQNTATGGGPLPPSFPSKYEISTYYSQLPYEELKWSYPRAASAVSGAFVFSALALIFFAQMLVQSKRNGFPIPRFLRHRLIPASLHFLAASALIVAWGAFVGLFQWYYKETILTSGGTTSGSYSECDGLAGATCLRIRWSARGHLCCPWLLQASDSPLLSLRRAWSWWQESLQHSSKMKCWCTRRARNLFLLSKAWRCDAFI